MILIDAFHNYSIFLIQTNPLKNINVEFYKFLKSNP